MESEKPFDLLETIRGLPFSKDEYMVFGSGILTVLGLRRSADLDLLVTPELFDQMKSSGWETSTVEIEGRVREKITKGNIEAFKEFWCNGIDYDIKDLLRSATVIDGVRFMPLLQLIEMKRSMGREKDLRDIALIESYLART